MQALVVISFAIVAYIIYNVIDCKIRDRHYANEARRLGCKDPIKQKSSYFGFDIVLALLRADRQLLFPQYLVESFKRMNAWTFEYTVPGSQRTISTCDPKIIQTMLATKFNDFSLGKRRKEAMQALLGNGIFSQDGKAWEHSRALMRPQFARDQISDLDLEERHVQNLIKALGPGQVGERDTLWTATTDLQVLFFRLTLDSATEFLFGESVNSQLAEMNPTAAAGMTTPSTKTTTTAATSAATNERAFAHAFENGQAWLATKARFQDWHSLVTGPAYVRSCKQTHDFADHFVRLALEKSQDKEEAEDELEKGVESEQNQKKKKYVFLEALVAETRDPLELRWQALNILLAGRDTTGSHLGWLFLMLSRNRQVHHKLRAVVLDTFGTYDDPRDISFARLKACRYLQYCNNETLRLFAVVPWNSRQAVRDTVLPTGGGSDGTAPIFVRKGQYVEYSVHVMHRRRDLWGEDVLEFKPERWEERKVGWEYLPFNGGPRICIGQQFALTEASYVMVRLLQQFDDLEDMDPTSDIRYNQTLTMCSGNGCKVRLHKAASG
ncbi:MAG: hypothetical protein M1825_004980 [Sarcosagium campestre]|nr:MAG: hypothetical protein M1825_004980 [Sarcosagium campestre]